MHSTIQYRAQIEINKQEKLLPCKTEQPDLVLPPVQGDIPLVIDLVIGGRVDTLVYDLNE